MKDDKRNDEDDERKDGEEMEKENERITRKFERNSFPWRVHKIRSRTEARFSLKERADRIDQRKVLSEEREGERRRREIAKDWKTNESALEDVNMPETTFSLSLSLTHSFFLSLSSNPIRIVKLNQEMTGQKMETGNEKMRMERMRIKRWGLRDKR